LEEGRAAAGRKKVLASSAAPAGGQRIMLLPVRVLWVSSANPFLLARVKKK